jgi:hypothetical protein
MFVCVAAGSASTPELAISAALASRKPESHPIISPPGRQPERLGHERLTQRNAEHGVPSAKKFAALLN